MKKIMKILINSTRCWIRKKAYEEREVESKRS